MTEGTARLSVVACSSCRPMSPFQGIMDCLKKADRDALSSCRSLNALSMKVLHDLAQPDGRVRVLMTSMMQVLHSQPGLAQPLCTCFKPAIAYESAAG